MRLFSKPNILSLLYGAGWPVLGVAYFVIDVDTAKIDGFMKGAIPAWVGFFYRMCAVSICSHHDQQQAYGCHAKIEDKS